MALGQIHKSLKPYTTGTNYLETIDKRLLKGFYTSDRKELENLAKKLSE